MSDNSIKQAFEETLQLPIEQDLLRYFNRLVLHQGKESCFVKVVQSFSQISYYHFLQGMALTLSKKYGCSESLSDDLAIMVRVMENSINDEIIKLDASMIEFEKTQPPKQKPYPQTLPSFSMAKG